MSISTWVRVLRRQLDVLRPRCTTPVAAPGKCSSTLLRVKAFRARGKKPVFGAEGRMISSALPSMIRAGRTWNLELDRPRAASA